MCSNDMSVFFIVVVVVVVVVVVLVLLRTWGVGAGVYVHFGLCWC